MKLFYQHIFILLLLLTLANTKAQNIQRDFFDNLTYQSPDKTYQAFLKENIFGDITFSDNSDNQVVFKNEYIKVERPYLKNNKDAQMNLFIDLIRSHQQDEGYRASYNIDIFGKFIFENNKNKTELDSSKEKQHYYKKTSIKHRQINNTLFYSSDTKSATLQKDTFDYWIYKDSKGNSLKLNSTAWQHLEDEFGNKDQIFQHLLEQYLF